MKKRLFILISLCFCLTTWAQESIAELKAQEKTLKAESRVLNDKKRAVDQKVRKLRNQIKVIEAQPKIEAAIAKLVVVKPQKPRKLLIYSRTMSFRHSSIELGVSVFKALGEKTGAFTVTATEDPSIFTDEKSAQGIVILIREITLRWPWN